MFLNISQNSQENLCQSLIFNKVAGSRPQGCNLIKKETLVQVFSCEFCKIYKNTFFIEHIRWLLLFYTHEEFRLFFHLETVFLLYDLFKVARWSLSNMVHRQLFSGMERTYIYIFFIDFPFFHCFSFLSNIRGAISERNVIW